MQSRLRPSGTEASRVTTIGALYHSAKNNATGASAAAKAWKNWKPDTYTATTRWDRPGNWSHSRLRKTWMKPYIQRTRGRTSSGRVAGVSSRVTRSSRKTTSTS